MLPAQLSSINEDHLNDLVAGGVRESRSIEFKAKLVWGTDSEKKEFLADVSALANGGGGDLIFGIEEDQGVAAAVVGLASFDPDRDGLRIESILRDGIAPRIVGIRVQPVALSDGRTAIIVRVPNSLHRPHMVVFKQGSRFYSRNSAGKYQLDVHELRSAFIASESVADRIRQFRIERIDAILQGNTPETLSGNSYICIHMIPVAAYDPSFSFDIERVREPLLPIGRQGCNPSVNFDGRLFSAPYGFFIPGINDGERRQNGKVFDVKIFRALSTYQFTDRLLFRNIMEFNSHDETLGLNFLATYRVNAGTALYVGYNDHHRQFERFDEQVNITEMGYRQTNRAVFTKFQYLFRY